MKIALIDMPFSLIECSAFGLTQIKTHLDNRYADAVKTDILYLNHDFYTYFGKDVYQMVNHDFYDFYKFDTNPHMWVDKLKKSGLEVEYFSAMLGEWIFRAAAFPSLDDNEEAYFKQFPLKKADLKALIMEKRSTLLLYMQKLIERYKIDRYDLVGFTSRFQQQTAAIALSRLLKESNSSVITVMGGPNCEPPAGATLAYHIDSIDYILSGRRFLIGFEQMIQCIMDNNKEQIESIQGLFSKKKNAVIFPNIAYEASEEDNIDNLVNLNYDSYFHSIESKLPNETISPILFLETSRGCSWGEKDRCNFCAIDGYNPKHRCMSAQSAIKYINQIFDKYSSKCKYYVFVDSTLPKYYFNEVFPYLNIPENATLLYEARADLTEYEISLLAKCHIRLLIVGIESFSTPALQLLNKGRTAFDNIRFLMLCRKYGINVNWNILSGIPGETESMLGKNLTEIKKFTHLYPPTGIWLVSFQGNCNYKEHQEKYGLSLTPDIDALSFIYPFEEIALGQITYFSKKSLNNMSRKEAVLIHKISKEVTRWKERWYEAFPGELPQLCFVDSTDGKKIADTRTIPHQYIDVDAIDCQILYELKNEKSRDEIYQRVGFQDFTEVEKRIQTMLANGFLFEENNSLISLVMDDYGI